MTGATVTVATDGSEVMLSSDGANPAPVAVLSMVPLSMSAWVAEYGAVQVVLEPAASVVTGQTARRSGPAGGVRVDDRDRGLDHAGPATPLGPVNR